MEKVVSKLGLEKKTIFTNSNEFIVLRGFMMLVSLTKVDHFKIVLYISWGLYFFSILNFYFHLYLTKFSFTTATWPR
jgi:hypothetical protein